MKTSLIFTLPNYIKCSSLNRKYGCLFLEYATIFKGYFWSMIKSIADVIHTRVLKRSNFYNTTYLGNINLTLKLEYSNHIKQRFCQRQPKRAIFLFVSLSFGLHHISFVCTCPLRISFPQRTNHVKLKAATLW